MTILRFKIGPYLSLFTLPLHQKPNPIFEVQIIKKCYSMYNPGSLKLKFNVQFAM